VQSITCDHEDPWGCAAVDVHGCACRLVKTEESLVDTRTRLKALEDTIEEADLAGIKIQLDKTGQHQTHFLLKSLPYSTVSFNPHLAGKILSLMACSSTMCALQRRDARYWKPTMIRWRSSWIRPTRRSFGWKLLLFPRYVTIRFECLSAIATASLIWRSVQVRKEAADDRKNIRYATLLARETVH
jgi:hypothetical protein